MGKRLTAKRSLVIDAAPAEIWHALTDPDQVSKAFFGAQVDTDWQEGSPIIFSGEWQGRSFRDHGEIVKVKRDKILQFTHFSPLSGQPDTPENYHTVTFEMAPRDGGTEVTVSQTNAATEEERQHSEENWGQLLTSIKSMVEH